MEVDTTCQPLYEPIYDEVFSRTIAAKCGLPGSACHSAQGRQGGLVLVEVDEAYDLLLDGRVVPGEPGCSAMVKRLESLDPELAMPPGARLNAQERCAVIRWIADGAER